MSLEFAHRVCLSVTIVVMVNHTALEPTDAISDDDMSCADPLAANETDPLQQGDFLWTPSTQGVILGAYFYGFVCTQILGGRLAELAGGKWPLGLAIFFGSLLTLATPIAADIGVSAIVIVRIIMGLLHGLCLPTAFALFAHWAPLEERSTLIAVCVIGDHVGTVLSMPLAGYLCENGFAGGWPSVFYVLGLAGCVWFLFWVCFAYNTPAEHPRISRRELCYIQKGNIQIGDEQKLPVPWRHILSSSSVWSIVVVTFCSAWGQTTLLTKLPTYLELVLHVPIQKNGLFNSLIYVCSCATLFISGYLSDYLRSVKSWHPTRVRKGFQIGAMAGPALCTALIPVVGCNKNAAVALLTMAMAFLGLCGGGHVSMAADMSPHHAATIFGLVSGLGCTAGIFSPLVAGVILEDAHASISHWSVVFYLSAVLYLFGGLVFMVWASSERQLWAFIPQKTFLHPRIDPESTPIVKKYSDFQSSLNYGALT